MTLRLALAFAAFALAGSAAGAASQQVYRCGPDGRVYSQTPCKDGYVVATDDARSEAQRKAALETVQTDAKLAERMTREREARERAAAQKGPTIIANSGIGKPATAAATAASAPARKKAKRPPKTTKPPAPQA